MKTFIRRHGVIIGIALFVLAVGYLFVQPEPKLTNKLNVDKVVPMSTKLYTGEDVDLSAFEIEDSLGSPQAILMRNYTGDSQNPVLLCLVYNYARRSRSFHDPEVCYPAQGYTLTYEGPRQLTLDGQNITGHVMTASKSNFNSLVLYWYMSGDTPVQERGGRKGHLLTAIQSRLKRTIGVSSMVRVSVPITGSKEEAYKELVTFLDEFYPKIRTVRADIAQNPMPFTQLRQHGPVGMLAVGAMLILPLGLAVAGIGMGSSKTGTSKQESN